MSEALEHAEHAAHGAHTPGPGKMIGLTMAILGVLLAVCAAKVGGERTELTRTLVEQTQAQTESQANQMKYRLVMLQLEKSRAMLAPGGAAKSEPTAAVDLVESRTLDRLLALVTKYISEKEATKAWVKSFTPLIEAHFEAAEHFEYAQLLAEVGIVIASIALLLASKKVWFVSLTIGSVSVGTLVFTQTHAGHKIHVAEENVAEIQEKYQHLKKVQDPNKDDAVTIDMLDPGGVRRAANAAQMAKEAGPKEEHKVSVEAH